MQRNSYRRYIQCSERERESQENCHYPSRQGTCAACDALGSDIYVAGECLIISIRGSDGPLQRHTAHSSHTCGIMKNIGAVFCTVLTAVARSYQSYNTYTRWPSRLLYSCIRIVDIHRHKRIAVPSTIFRAIIIILSYFWEDAEIQIRNIMMNKSFVYLKYIFFRKSFINVQDRVYLPTTKIHSTFRSYQIQTHTYVTFGIYITIL